jgi:hypothetical protein
VHLLEATLRWHSQEVQGPPPYRGFVGQKFRQLGESHTISQIHLVEQRKGQNSDVYALMQSANRNKASSLIPSLDSVDSSRGGIDTEIETT